MPFDYTGKGYINSVAVGNLNGATAEYGDWIAAPTYDYGNILLETPYRFFHLGSHGAFSDIIAFVYGFWNYNAPPAEQSAAAVQLFWRQGNTWYVGTPRTLPRTTNALQRLSRLNARVLDIGGQIYLVVMSLFDQYANGSVSFGVHLLRLDIASTPTMTHINHVVYGINNPNWGYFDLRYDANILRWHTDNQVLVAIMHYTADYPGATHWYRENSPHDEYRVDFFLVTVNGSSLSLSGPLSLYPGEYAPYKSSRMISLKNHMLELDASQRRYISIVTQEWQLPDEDWAEVDALAIITFSADFSSYSVAGYTFNDIAPEYVSHSDYPFAVRANNTQFGAYVRAYIDTPPPPTSVQSLHTFNYVSDTTPPQLVQIIRPNTLSAFWTGGGAYFGAETSEGAAQLRFADRGGLVAVSAVGNDGTPYGQRRVHTLLDVIPTGMQLVHPSWFPPFTGPPYDVGVVATHNNRVVFIGEDSGRLYFRIAQYGSLPSLAPTPLLSWSVSDDLPTEEVGRPQFTRRSLEISVPVSYEPNAEVVLQRPTNPHQPYYRGIPRDSARSGGLVRMELEPIESRWQRAISKRRFILSGAHGGRQTLEALLAMRYSEFDYLRWQPIPDLYWPDGSVPTLQNPSTNSEISVYDEVLEILSAFPGYTIDWTPDDDLRIVIPPFAPNAPAPLALTARDGNYERTGLAITETVRSARVRSQPYEFSADRDYVAQPVALRIADNEFATSSIANKPDTSTRGSINTGSTQLVVGTSSIFQVGDWLYVPGAGSGNQALQAQIVAISGGIITLNTPAQNSASNVLVRFLHNYPPPPDDAEIISTERRYGAGYVEYTYRQSFNEDIIVQPGSVQISISVDTWRLPALPPPLPYQTTETIVDVPISTSWTLIYDSNVRDRLAMIFETNNNRVRVYARIVDNSVEYRINASTYGDGAVNTGSGITSRRWFAGYRFTLEARASIWKRGNAVYVGEYRNPTGYLDLPEIDVSLTGITDNTLLQRLAQLIADYRSRQRIQWRLELSQPWALNPEHKGRLVQLPGGTLLIPDSYRLGVAYGADSVDSNMSINAWQYARIIEVLSNSAGDLLANNAGNVLGR